MRSVISCSGIEVHDSSISTMPLVANQLWYIVQISGIEPDLLSEKSSPSDSRNKTRTKRAKIQYLFISSHDLLVRYYRLSHQLNWDVSTDDIVFRFYCLRFRASKTFLTWNKKALWLYSLTQCALENEIFELFPDLNWDSLSLFRGDCFTAWLN